VDVGEVLVVLVANGGVYGVRKVTVKSMAWSR
jgi:hypothetical protein